MDNKVEMGVLKLFPTLVYQIDASELIESSLKILDKVSWTNKENNASTSKYVLRSNKKLVSKFNDKINLCLDTLEYELPFKMTTSWWTKTAPGDVVIRHNHTNCVWSAVFYPHEDASALVIENADNRPMIDIAFKCSDPQYMPYGTAHINPKKGCILIFPSHLYHWTLKNTSNKYRYSLAMNFMPHGNVYHGDSSYNFQ
tara:strand:+ start:698 stop:1294 length:597 start_codon:yes stop_codon:yes gene_type:complete